MVADVSRLLTDCVFGVVSPVPTVSVVEKDCGTYSACVHCSLVVTLLVLDTAAAGCASV